MTDNFDDDMPLMWTPKPGEEVKVWTAPICEHFGGCAQCKGMSTTKELGIDTGNPDEDLPVFCDHWCHHAAPKV